jgi:hypothetical protein
MTDFSNVNLGKEKKPTTSSEWARERLAAGESPFTDQQKIRFVRIKDKYSREYLPLLTNLSRRLLTKTGRARKGQAEIIEGIQKVVKAIGQVSQDAENAATNKVAFTSIEEIKKFTTTFANNLKSIEIKVMQIIKAARENTALEREIKRAQAETDVTLEEVERMSQLATGVMQRTAPELKKELTPIEALGKGLAIKTAGAFLGPFAGMAQAAVQTVTGLVKRQREEHIARQEAQFAGLARYARETPESFVERREEVSKVAGTRLRSGVEKEGIQKRTPKKIFAGGQEINMGELPPQVQETLRAGMEEEPATAKERPVMPEEPMVEGQATRPEEGKREKGKAGVGGLLGKATAGSLAAAFITFFNKDAYMAKWTKEALNYLRIISLQRGGKGGALGFLDNLFGGVGGKLGKVGSAIGFGAKTLFGGYGALGGAAGLGGILSGLGKGGLWGGLVKGGANLLGMSKLATAIPMIGKFAGVLGKFAGPIGWALTAIQAGMGAVKGVKAAGQIFGTEKATLGQKAAAGFGGALESLTFGLLKKENVAKFTYSLSKAIGDSFKAHPFKMAFASLLGPLGPIGMGLAKMWQDKKKGESLKKAYEQEELAKVQFMRAVPQEKKLKAWEKAAGREYKAVSGFETPASREYKAVSGFETPASREYKAVSGFETPASREYKAITENAPTARAEDQPLSPVLKESIRQTVQTIPATNEVAKIPESLGSMTSQLNGTMKELASTFKTSQARSQSIVTKRTGDTYGIKDPILDLLNSGNLGVAT